MYRREGSEYTVGYMEVGVAPEFKLLKEGDLKELGRYIPIWSYNEFLMVSNLLEALAMPETFSQYRVYPNPFNPVTNLSFALYVDSDVSISIYNLQGREVVS